MPNELLIEDSMGQLVLAYTGDSPIWRVIEASRHYLETVDIGRLEWRDAVGQVREWRYLPSRPELLEGGLSDGPSVQSMFPPNAGE